MKIRPLADKVLVQRLEAENKTAGGIVLPDSTKKNPKEAKSSASARARCSTMEQ